jgi:hypothetical protein
MIVMYPPDPRLDQEASIRLAQKIHPEHSRCWANAQRAVRDVPELHDAWYVEGIAVVVVDRVFQHFDHGWIETADGRILDPTLAHHPAVRRDRLDSITLEGTKIYRLVWPARYPLRGGKRDWPIAYFAASRFERNAPVVQDNPDGIPQSGNSDGSAATEALSEAVRVAEAAYPDGSSVRR